MSELFDLSTRSGRSDGIEKNHGFHGREKNMIGIFWIQRQPAILFRLLALPDLLTIGLNIWPN